MDFITVRDLRTSPSKVWKKLGEEKELVITNNGKPFALLTPVTGQSLEKVVRAFRKASMEQSITDMRGISLENGNDNMSMEEIDAEIRETRKNNNALRS